MGDILQRRKLGTTWEPDLQDSSLKLPTVSKLWRALPRDLRIEWSSILSPDRKWSSPTPENERVGFVAWQWLQHFHRGGLSTNVRPNWSLLASLLPRGTVITDTRLHLKNNPPPKKKNLRKKKAFKKKQPLGRNTTPLKKILLKKKNL